MVQTNIKYIGRFAPTPSGKLHFGSLVTALGSYLRAKSLKGFWHLRIEDIDEPRCNNENTLSIINTLKDFAFEWDGEILYQSQRKDRYKEVLEILNKHNLTYSCSCTRSDIKNMGGIYNNRCRDLNIPPSNSNAIRFKNDNNISSFKDSLLGNIDIHNIAFAENNDFILKRRDGYYSYNLSCVVDDIDTNITEIVRGNDILSTTFAQLNLRNAIITCSNETNCNNQNYQHNSNNLNFIHLPLVLCSDTQKYSKQNHATPIDSKLAKAFLCVALLFLEQKIIDEIDTIFKKIFGNDKLVKLNTVTKTELEQLERSIPYSCEQILDHAIKNFNFLSIPTNNKILIIS